jgi:hypothetical protein
VKVSWPGDNPDAQNAIDYYSSRNRFASQLASPSKADMLTIFESALADHGNAGLSVVFDTLCARCDWYDTADVLTEKRSTTSGSDGGSAKRARVTTTR